MLNIGAAWVLLGGLSAARAQEISINVSDSVAQRYGLDSASIKREVSSAIDDNLNLADQQEFLDAMAEAAALSTRGMGVDYASNVERVVFGVSVGSAVNSSGVTLSRQGRELPDGGFSFQLAAMAGINLGMGREEGFFSRVRLYGSGMALGTGGESFSGSLYNYAAHLQFQLVRPQVGAAAEWGGLALTSGSEVAGYALSLSQPLPISTAISGQDIAWEATGTYDVDAATSSIPLELSTNVRILLVTLYGGGGVDWNQGGATSVIGLSGPLNVDDQSGSAVELGSASVSYGGRGLADAFVPRAFVGAQLDILAIKVYGHLNAGLNGSFGGHTGLRLAF